MSLNRRRFLGTAAAAAAASALPQALSAQSAPAGLAPITGGAVPISVAEREARIARAQELMRRQGLSAILIEPGASLVYFTGVRWGRSERLTGAVIPAQGRIGVFTPFFEEPSVRESLAVPADLRTWNEHEDPLALVGAWLKERKLGSGARSASRRPCATSRSTDCSGHCRRRGSVRPLPWCGHFG